MEQRTHPHISPRLVGEAVSIEEGKAVAALTTVEEMAADERGLVHGGFTFGLADFAAMLAVNDPHVVLGGANGRYLAPVKVGQRMIATATVQEVKKRKHVVAVSVVADGTEVYKGELTCFVLDKHVLD